MTFVPPAALGSFQFPAPYYTRGMRLTNSSNAPHGCEGRMYSYWCVINNHRGRDELYVFVERTGQNPIVLKVHKASGRVSLLRELPWAGLTTGEGSYFSDTDPVKLYACVGNELMTTNVETGETATAFTLDPQYGDNIWQAHSSADDSVHSATARRRTADGPYEKLGTVVVRHGQQRFIRASGDLDESHLTKNGRYLAIEQDDDLLVFDLDLTASPRRIGDREGAPAHCDCGESVVVGEDNWHEAGALVLWDLADPHSQRRLIYASGGASLGHVAIRDGRLLLSSNRTSELIYLSTDGNFSRHVAPGMIEGDYDHQLRACLDVLGEYGAWIAQIEGRLDLMLVRLPDDLPPIYEGGSAVTPFETLKSLRRNYPTPMSADQLGELLNAVAWAHKDQGYGVFAKPSGGNCRQPRTGILISRDILALKDGHAYDVLMDAEGAAKPTWGEKEPGDGSRWRAPVDPAGAGTLPEQPPATGGGGGKMIPYDEAKAVEFGRACNDVYTESGAAFDPGMIAVHAQRAAYDYYVGGLPWPESRRKHVNEFRAEYGLKPV